MILDDQDVKASFLAYGGWFPLAGRSLWEWNDLSRGFPPRTASLVIGLSLQNFNL